MPSNSTGSDQINADSSIGAFTSSLLVNTAVAAAMFVAFCIVRHWNRKIFQPRTYLVPEDVRSPPLPPGIFSWVTASFSVRDNELLDKVGLDAYMFLRFLRMSAMFFAGCTLLGIPILIPINVVNGSNVGGLANMTIGNVRESWRLWFHLILTILFCSSAVILLWREMQEYTRRRHAFLLSEKHAKTPQATTILVTAIPDGLNTEDALHPKNIVELCKERDQIVKKLEMAIYNYIRSAYGKKKRKKEHEEKEPVRPVGRTSIIPCVGKKVDLIDVYSNRLAQLNREISGAQEVGTVKTLNSAFIQFHTQFAAHSAVQTVVHPTTFNMTPMYAEISPLDVVWDNMDMHIVIRKFRHFLSLGAATALALFWTVPVIFVSSIANIASIVETFQFLAFLQDLPPKALGIIEGVLPPLFLAILMALLPMILTMMANNEGHVRYSAITLSVMSKYFFFLVVNVLLISTLTGGFLTTWDTISKGGFNFMEIINLLSVNLPRASTFFITYTLLKGFTGPVLELLQITPLILNFLFTTLLAKSPRQIWDVQGRLISVDYGIIFPLQTLMFCIGIVFSTMAPLILPFVTFYFIMFYFVYRHQFLYIYHQPIDTGGLAFPKAVKQSYTGIFICEITILGIFLAKQATLNIVPQMVLLGILIVATAFSLSSLNQAFNPLVTFLPVALFSKDLHVDKDGFVTNGNPAKAFAQVFVSTIAGAEEGVKSVKTRAQHFIAKLTGVQEDTSVMAMDNLSNRNLTRVSDVPTIDGANHPDQSQSPQPQSPSQLQSTPQPQSPPQLQSQPQFEMSKQEYYDTVEIDSYNRASSIMKPGGPYEHSPSYDQHIHPLAGALDQHIHPFAGANLDQREYSSQHLSSPPLLHPYMQPGRSESSLRDRSASFASKPASVMDRPVSYMDRPVSFKMSDNALSGRDNQLPEPSPVDIELERMQDRAYCHPAIYNVQTPVWLPQDARGLVQEVISKLTSMGIVVATDGAGLNASTAKASVGNIIYAPVPFLNRGAMDDDFDDFGDIDESALAMTLEQEELESNLANQHLSHGNNSNVYNKNSFAGQSMSAPRNSFPQPNGVSIGGNKGPPGATNGTTTSHPRSTPAGLSAGLHIGQGVITAEDYEDFGDWTEGDLALAFDDDEFALPRGSATSSGSGLNQQQPQPPQDRTTWPNMNGNARATNPIPFQVQQRPQQQQAQHAKLFPIFGGNNGNNNQTPLQRAGSTEKRNTMQRQGSLAQPSINSATALSRTLSSSSTASSGTLNRAGSDFSTRSDSGNTIFNPSAWRPPTSAASALEPLTHHTIDYEAIKTWQHSSRQW
ncbi:hypothetical protein BG000_001213 [Podila horticola]|nr:hypothetical protein BG000_001213 [Podila horticola]